MPVNVSSSKMADAVFEGGGVKGIGLVGAVAVAEEREYRWANVAGTSAGAIVAALLAAGYNSQELRKIITELDYNDFKDPSTIDKVPGIGPVTSLIFEKGIYEGKFFEDWIRELLSEKGVKTFANLVDKNYGKDSKYHFKLRVIASDITQGKMLVLPQDIAEYGIKPEDLDVARAVRMSMSIPFFYEPVILNYKKKIQNTITKQDSYIVDGGLLSNFPVWLFDSEGDSPEWPTFGFKLVEPEEGTPHRINGPISLLMALFSTMMQAHDARYIKDENFARTIPIPTLNVGTTEFNLKRGKSESLYESGRKAAAKFFDSWNFTEYVNKYRKGKPEIHRSSRVRSKPFRLNGIEIENLGYINCV